MKTDEQTCRCGVANCTCATPQIDVVNVTTSSNPSPVDSKELSEQMNVEPVDLKPRKLEDISRDIAGSFFEYPTPSFYRLDAEVLNALEKAVIRSTSPLQAEIERMELVAASKDAEIEELKLHIAAMNKVFGEIAEASATQMAGIINEENFHLLTAAEQKIEQLTKERDDALAYQIRSAKEHVKAITAANQKIEALQVACDEWSQRFCKVTAERDDWHATADRNVAKANSIEGQLKAALVAKGEK